MGTDLYYEHEKFNATGKDVPTLIGLSGWATAGKDTVGDVIATYYGHQRVSFAHNMKTLARLIDPYVAFPTSDKVRLNELVNRLGWTEAKKHPEARRFLQELGTRCREILGPDIWVDSLWRLLEDGKPYVFTDVRFLNEANRIRENGGIVLRVRRPGVGPVNQHESEISLDHYDFDGYIDNTGSLMDLHGEVMITLGDFS